MNTEKAKEIYNQLKNIVNSKKHYLVSVFDTASNVFMGDCELIEEDSYGRIYISSIRSLSDTQRVIKKLVYVFSPSGNYNRTAYDFITLDVDDYHSIKDRLEKLENKLNEITQTE